MIGWILIGILVVLVFFILKFKEIRHKLSFLLILALILFLVVSASTIYSKNKVDLKSFDGVVSAGKLYFSWLGSLFHNVKDISGYAVKQDWNTKNNTIAPGK